MPETFVPELGQLAFGNPGGAFGFNHDEELYVSEKLREIVEIIDKKGLAEIVVGGLGGRYGYGADFKNNVFEMHPYYWGECNCGFDEKETAWLKAHPHTENCYQIKLRKFIDTQKENGIAENSDEMRHKIDQWTLDNYNDSKTSFYCDCSQSQEWDKFLEENDHLETCLTVVPNFRCEGIEIRWYKYIGRGMSINREIKREELRQIFRKVRESLESV